MTNCAELLKSKNMKITPQRLAIYSVLSSTKTHPSAEMIYKSLEELYPTMSLATVYKTLSSFKEYGLVRELSVSEDCFRYDADVYPHAHFICTVCNSVFDLDYFEYIEDMRKKVREDEKYLIEYEQVNFYGKCESCRENHV